MSSIYLVISEKDNKLKSALSLILHNSFTVAASDIFVLSEILFPISLKEYSYTICPISTAYVMLCYVMLCYVMLCYVICVTNIYNYQQNKSFYM